MVYCHLLLETFALFHYPLEDVCMYVQHININYYYHTGQGKMYPLSKSIYTSIRILPTPEQGKNCMESLI
jgi:hypothetical protein